MSQLVWACGDGDCRPVIPSVLPSGAPTGAASEGVSGGAPQVTWGMGSDLVDQRIGLSYHADGEPVLATTQVRGESAIIYQVLNDSAFGFTWRSDDCTYSVFLAPEKSLEQVVEYAERF
jgi:hypothetical protein